MHRGRALLALAAACVLASATGADANWLSTLAREVGEVGAVSKAGKLGKLGKLALGPLDAAAAYVARLPPVSKGAALAAHATPEGHWKFANREGEIFTAASPDEMARVGAVLAPDAAGGGKLSLYLSEDTVFREAALMRELPADAELYVVVGSDAYKLVRREAAGGAEAFVAEVRPNISLALGDRALFEEAVYQLARPLNRSSIRVLALEPGGPKTLSSVPRFESGTQTALVDAIDPGSLSGALSKVKGQTVLVTGRVEGDVLVFHPGSGPEQKLFVRELMGAAEAADVNVVILETAVPRQPGGRNWLWQKVQVSGLDEAMRRATFADFLNALAGEGGDLAVTAARGAQGRVTLTAVPASGETWVLPGSGAVGETVGAWIGEVTGHVAVKAVQVNVRDRERSEELDRRLIPGIPSGLQYAYLGGLVCGLFAWWVAWGWFAAIWPAETRKEYSGRIGYQLARAARLIAFVLVFLPLVGVVALMWAALLQLGSLALAPFRFVSWLRGRVATKAG